MLSLTHTHTDITHASIACTPHTNNTCTHLNTNKTINITFSSMYAVGGSVELGGGGGGGQNVCSAQHKRRPCALNVCRPPCSPRWQSASAQITISPYMRACAARRSLPPGIIIQVINLYQCARTSARDDECWVCVCVCVMSRRPVTAWALAWT